jgi:hypothetical protein
MLRALCLAMTLFVLPLQSARSDAGPNLGANAALKYWQAFAALPRFTQAEQQELGDCLNMPLDAHARDFVTRAAYALRMLHRGAALPQCDWGSGWEEDGVEILLPQNDAARVMANLACLRARLRFEGGDSAAAIEDIVAGMTLARHISRDSVLVMVLAGYAIEHRMTETLALYLPRLNAEMIRELKRRLDALPPGGTPATGVRLEEKWALNWLIRKVKEAGDRESLLAFLSRLASEGKNPDAEKGRAFLEACGGSAEGVLKFAEEARPSYALVADKLDQPLDQFARDWEHEEMKQAGNPVFKLIFPAVAKVRWAQARADVRRALLAAALAVQLDGAAALNNHPDPVVGGPFEHVAFEGGFELRSNLKPDDQLRTKWRLDERSTKPVTLTAGRRRN